MGIIRYAIPRHFYNCDRQIHIIIYHSPGLWTDEKGFDEWSCRLIARASSPTMIQAWEIRASAPMASTAQPARDEEITTSKSILEEVSTIR